MKSIYKKVSVIALSSMIIAGGIASSGINAQAYDPSELKRQIEDLGRGAGAYYDVKYIVNRLDSVVEAVFSSKEEMNRYVESNYWDKVNRQSNSYKDAKKDLSNGVDCGNDAMQVESEIKKRELGDVFRVRYRNVDFLIRKVKYKKLSDIPKISGRDIERNLSRDNQKLYYRHLRDVIEKAGYRVVLMHDKNKVNDKKMKDYIQDRFKEGVFSGDKRFEEELLVGIGCIGFGAFEHNLKYRYSGDVMRLNHQGIDMLLISNK